MNEQAGKIVIAAGLYPPDIGGPATYAKLIEDELPMRGYEVVVVPYRDVRSTPKPFRHLRYTWRLWRASRGAAAVYALDPVSVGLPALAVATLRRTPLLLRLGGDYAWEQGRQRWGVVDDLNTYSTRRQAAPFLVRVLHTVQRLVARRAVRVIVPSKYLGRIVASWPVPTERIQVIYSVVEDVEPGLSQGEARRRLSLPEDALVLATAARLVPWKGVDMLIQLMRERKDAGQSGVLLVVGDGPEREQLESLAEVQGVHEQVRFVGALPHADTMATLKAADVFLLNTAYEGLSHFLLEVMSLQVPIVTTPVGGNPELITDQVSGRLVPVNDLTAWQEAVTELLADTNAQQRYVAAATDRLQAFSVRTMVSELEEVLASVGVKPVAS